MIQRSAIVLAGGASRRLGQDKRRLRLWGAAGPSLLEHSIQVLATLCSDIVVVLNDPQDWPQLAARLIPDIYPDGGALGGIYSGLCAAQHDAALVVACDMPFLNTDLLHAMLSRADNYDALVPRALHPGNTRNTLDLEPLHAIYRKSCLAPMRTMLDDGQRQIAGLFARVTTAYFEAEETRRYDRDGRSLINLNTLEQVTQAQQWIEHSS